MSDRLFVKPAQPNGADAPLKVRKPTGGHLAEQGEYVPDESYWRRRLNDGDVVQADPPKEAAAARAGKSS